MHCADPLVTPIDLPSPPYNGSDIPATRDSAPERLANPKRLEIKRETLANAGIITLTGISLVPLLSSIAPQDSSLSYEGKFQLAIDPATTPRKTAPVEKTTAPERTIDYETTTRVLWSPKAVTSIVRRLRTTYPDLTTEVLLRNLTVTHKPGSNRVLVTYRSTDQAKTKVVLTQLASSYLQFTQNCHGRSCRAAQFIDRRTNELQQQKAKLEQSLASLQQSSRISNSEQFGQSLTQRTQSLVQQQNQLRIQMAESRAQASILQKQMGLTQPLADDLLQQNSRYQQLLAQLHPVVSQTFLVFSDPRNDPASLKPLQQQYQQLYTQLSKAAQVSVLEGVSAIQSKKIPKGKDLPELRSQMLQQWIAVVHQMQVIRLQQQEIAQSQQRLQTLVQQWAAFDRKSSAIQVKLQAINQQLNLYQQRKAEYRDQAHSEISAQLVSPPETAKVTDQLSWLRSNFLLLTGLTFPISLLLITWALAAIKRDRTLVLNQSVVSQQPEATLQQQTSRRQLNLMYYRWLFEKLASAPVLSFEEMQSIRALESH